MLTLDLNAIKVESFPTAEGDPTQWLMGAPPPTDDSSYECCSDDGRNWSDPLQSHPLTNCCPTL